MAKTMFVRAYLRASTSEQDASRARDALEAFATERGLEIATFHIENESGASLSRPELFRLLEDCRPGDILLVEQVDRLSRLGADDWERLKGKIKRRKVRVVAMDLPTSWQMTTGNGDEITARMFDAINAMMLDMLAAIARKDYEDRRRRQSQGIAKAKERGVYRGRKENTERNQAIVRMLQSGQSWSSIVSATGASRSLLSKLNKRMLKTGPT
jgi:DNA invertase Pin-like site-specific DNA recombinase